MNVQLPAQMDKPAFLAWLQDREERYELVESRVIMMPRPSRAHAIIVMNSAWLLRTQLDARMWTVIAEFGLDAGPKTLRFPDILVDRAGGDADDYTAVSPTLLVEVLSPSSEKVDIQDKALEYLRLPSVSAYVVFSQREPKAWVWTRSDLGFTASPELILGSDKIVHVAALGVSLPLSDVYAGVRTD